MKRKLFRLVSTLLGNSLSSWLSVVVIFEWQRSSRSKDKEEKRKQELKAVVNCPWWYLAYYKMLSPFITQRSKSKFVFSGPSRTAETLFKYVSPEHVPVQYGGLSVDYCECNPEFTIADPVTDIAVKPGTKQTVEIIIYERCVIIWELRVVGWEVSYSAEFVPETEDSYAIIIQKATKMAPNDEPVVCKRFKVNELGKLLLTIDNPTSKRKTLLYRYKINPLSD